MVNFALNSCLFGALGGILISISTSLHLLLKGRITGMSGIFFSLITLERASFYWKVSTVCGMLFAVSVLYNIWGLNEVVADVSIFDSKSIMISDLSFVGFALAGFFVGVGTKLGNGCTSGHGVCGLPRFSIRSFAAVGIFLSVAIAFSTFRYYVKFLDNQQGLSVIENENFTISANIVLGGSLLIFFTLLFVARQTIDLIQDYCISFVVGIIFAFGLGFSGMLRRSKIGGFLTISENWDPTLLFVLGFAVGCNLLTFHYIINIKKKPIFAEKLQIPTNKIIDAKLILGAACFGLGWGFGWLCPGPGLNLYPVFSLQIGLVWMFFLAAGQICGKYLEVFMSPQLNPKNIHSNSNAKQIFLK